MLIMFINCRLEIRDKREVTRAEDHDVVSQQYCSKQMHHHNNHINNYLLEMSDKKTREVTIEWRIQSNATRNRCFTPDFPISGKKHFCKEIIQYHVKTVESYIPHQIQPSSILMRNIIQHGIVPLFSKGLLKFRLHIYSARFLMLCSVQSHVSAADHATSSEVHTRNISSEKKPGVGRPKTMPVY